MPTALCQTRSHTAARRKIIISDKAMLSRPLPFNSQHLSVSALRMKTRGACRGNGYFPGKEIAWKHIWQRLSLLLWQADAYFNKIYISSPSAKMNLTELVPDSKWMPFSFPLYGTGQLFYGKCYVCLIAARTGNRAKLGSILHFRNCTYSQRYSALFQPVTGHEIKEAKKGEKNKTLTPEDWKDGKDRHRKRNWCKQTRGWTSAESILGENTWVESALLCAPVSRQPPRSGGHAGAPSETGGPCSGDQRPQKVGPSVERVMSPGVFRTEVTAVWHGDSPQFLKGGWAVPC